MSREHNPIIERPDREAGRLEAFSDGIFAVAITLLALDIGLPKGNFETEGSLLRGIFALWPKYFAYLNSFVTILLMWMAHHSIFNMVKHVTKPLIIANGFLLLLAVLTPFPTRVLGDFILSGSFRTAAVFYTGFFILISIAFTILWFVIKGDQRILKVHITHDLIISQTRIEFTGLACNILILLTTLLNPWAGLILNTAMWIYWLIKTQ